MVRIGSIGINLQDETKEVSSENKVLSLVSVQNAKEK